MLALATGGQFFTSNFHSMALLFKDERGLAKHPLSCHPQGLFGRQENIRKGEKVKESCRGGKAEIFGANFIGPLQAAVTRA